MSPHPPTASDPVVTCRTLGDELVRVERADPPRDESVLESLAAHLETCDACRARFGPRILRLQGLIALQRRSAPEGTFDEFFAEVRERVPFAPAGGGMSSAFLDAPRTLRLWRGAAMAASVLLVATAGFAFTSMQRTSDADPAGAIRPLHDPRERLLEAYDTRPDASRVRSVRDSNRRGHDGFFAPRPADVTPVGLGAGWR